MSTQAQLMTKAGFHFVGTKVLAAHPLRIANFHSLGYHFQALLDGRGNLKKPHYTAVRRADYPKLKAIVDPITDQPYLRFVMAKAPEAWFKEAEVGSVEELSKLADVEEFDEDELPPPRRIGRESEPEAESPAEGEEEAGEGDEAGFDAAFDGKPLAGAAPEPEAPSEPVGKTPVTPAELEREELEKMSNTELRRHLTVNLGIEAPPRAFKKDLVALAIG